MPVPQNITGQPMIGFSDPKTFFFGYSPSYLYDIAGLGWSMDEEPTFKTLAQMTQGGREVMNALYQNPLHNWKLKWNFLENELPRSLNPSVDTDFRVLYSFYCSMIGGYQEFLYEPRESAVTNQPLSTPDANGYVELVYNLGPFFAESVQELNGATPTIFVEYGGSIGTVNITSTCTFYSAASVAPYDGIVFSNASAFAPSIYSGQPIIADFNFFYRCHFTKDALSFEEFMYKLQKTGIEIKQVRI